MFTEERAKAILDKVIALSTADECTAQLSGSVDGNVRFALNEVSTSGVVSDTSLGVQVAFGRRTGTATINSFDDASLERVVRRAEELARLAPENPEFVPAVQKQSYQPSPTFYPATAAITPEYRARVAADSIAACKAGKLVAAGFLQDGQRFEAFANSNGNFGYQTASGMDYTCTVRTEDGSGSGWVGRNLGDVGQFDASREVDVAVRKARSSAGAKALEPGKYTVILEPAAAAGLVSFMMAFFDARQADEGRSFLSRKGGGNKLGEQVYDPRVDFRANPWDPDVPVMPWDDDGLAREDMPIVQGGKVMALDYSRYWAQKSGKRAVGRPGNLIMSGGDKSTADLVRGTSKGILVTRTWYIRMVDPQTVLLTGLTRDGTFYIEDGEIKYPVKNFRFNESPVIMLNNIEELGKPVRVQGDESRLSMMLPPMKLRDFTFTSLSDAV
jgi:Predicted Zn-dependent proteases and their inactivated homologs